jgi:hypothetical protein
MRKIVQILLFAFIGIATMNIAKAQQDSIDDGVIVYGIKWATRNLAAHGKFVEKPEDLGALFQWGRAGDGHEQRVSPNYPTDDTSEENGKVIGSENFDEYGQILNLHPAFGKFIKQKDQPWDWRSPQIDTLWNVGDEYTPIKPINDPCPEGWRLPTPDEIEILKYCVSEWTDSPAAGRLFGSGTDILFLPAAGLRTLYNGSILGVNTHDLE